MFEENIPHIEENTPRLNLNSLINHLNDRGVSSEEISKIARENSLEFSIATQTKGKYLCGNYLWNHFFSGSLWSFVFGIK